MLGQAPEREPGGHRPEHEGARTVAGEAASVVDEPIEAALLEPLALLAELLGGGAGELGDGRVGVVGGVGHGAELAGDAVERGGQVLGLALGLAAQLVLARAQERSGPLAGLAHHGADLALDRLLHVGRSRRRLPGDV